MEHDDLRDPEEELDQYLVVAALRAAVRAEPRAKPQGGCLTLEDALEIARAEDSVSAPPSRRGHNSATCRTCRVVLRVASAIAIEDAATPGQKLMIAQRVSAMAPEDQVLADRVHLLSLPRPPARTFVAILRPAGVGLAVAFLALGLLWVLAIHRGAGLPPSPSPGAPSAGIVTFCLRNAEGKPATVLGLVRTGAEVVLRASVVGIDAQARRRASETLTVALRPDGAVKEDVRIAPGLAAFACELLGGSVDGAMELFGAGYVEEGENRIDLWPVKRAEARAGQGIAAVLNAPTYPDTPQTGARLLFSTPDYFGALGPESAADRFAIASVNLFDDIRLSIGDRVRVDEGFDGYRPQTPVDDVKGMRGVWSGQLGLVAHAGGLAHSPPNVWVSEALPGWNRADGYKVTPDDARDARITFAAAVLLTDADKGACIGLIHKHGVPPGTAEVFSNETALVVFRNGQVRVSAPGLGSDQDCPPEYQGLAQFSALKWYAVRAEVDLTRGFMDVYLDNRLIGRNLPLMDDPNCGGGYQFNYFVVKGAYFAKPG